MVCNIKIEQVVVEAVFVPMLSIKYTILKQILSPIKLEPSNSGFGNFVIY